MRRPLKDPCAVRPLKPPRVGSHGQIFLALTLLLIAVVTVVLAAIATSQASPALHSAKADRAALSQVTAALRVQCAQQAETQTRLRSLEQADVDLQQRLIHVELHNPFVSAKLRAERLIAYRTKLASDDRFLGLPAPTPAVCAPFSQVLPTAYRAVG